MTSKNGWLNDWEKTQDEKYPDFVPITTISPFRDLSKFTLIELNNFVLELRLEITKRQCTKPL